MRRRDFITTGACVAGALATLGVAGCKSGAQGTAGAPLTAQSPASAPSPSPGSTTTPSTAAKLGKHRVFDKPPTDVHAAIATNKEPAELVKAAVDAFGGPQTFLRKGDTVVIKPNLAWGRTPDVGANTRPEILAAVIKMAQEAGASKVLVVEHSCDPSKVTFDMTGAKEVCSSLGVKLLSLDNESMYEECPIPQGVTIKSEKIPRDLLEGDVYINLPCLKTHGATVLSVAMKNQMGAIWRPQRYHDATSPAAKGPNLHQNIADLATALRPTIVIVDAIAGLVTNGPKGPGDLKDTRAVIVTHDMVTADMLSAQMLGISADKVPHIKLAAEAGVGRMDLDALRIVRV